MGDMSNTIKRILLVLIGSIIFIAAAYNLIINAPNLLALFNPEISSDFIPIYIPPDQPTPTPSIGQPFFPPDRIVVPKIELDAPVEVAPKGIVKIDGKEYQQFVAPEKFAAGWHIGSAALGVSGNTVLSGHHNAFGKVFKRLNELKEGDSFSLFSGGKEYKYVVTARMILPERDLPLEERLKNAQWILPTQDERITLITCWPALSNTHRLILVAIPVDKPQATPVYTPTPEPVFWVQNKIRWGVNLRQTASTDGKVLVTMPTQSVARCLGRNPKGDWLLVEFDEVQGWVAAENMRFDGDINLLRVYEP